MINENCPLCKFNENTVIYDIKEYKIVKCSRCSHVYSYFSEEINTEKLYETDNYSEVSYKKSYFEKILDYENKRILKKIELSTKSKKILDFGCGKGKFLNIAKISGWTCYGVETSLSRAEIGRKKYNLDISSSLYSNGKIENGDFDVITLFHVLEHIPDPSSLLCNLIKHNLKIKGKILIEVPNFESLQSKIAKIKWLHLDVPRHINHFNHKNLRKIIEDCGMKVDKMEYFSLIHGIEGILEYLIQPFGYKNIIAELKFKRNIKFILLLSLLFPLSLLIELSASILKKGAVLRIIASSK